MNTQQKELELAKEMAMKTVQESAFSEKGKEFLLSKLAYTLQISTNPTDEKNIPIGSSKFGGLPDLPSELEWPTYNCPIRGETPMSFIGQIYLPDVKPYDYHQVLPDRGWIYFFDSVEEQDLFQVYFYEGPKEKLQRTSLPDELRGKIWEIFHSCTLRFRPVWTLPAWQPIEIHDLKEHEYMRIDNDELMEVYEQLRVEIQGNRYSHQMFGYCWSWDEVEDYLLLLVDSDEHTNMCWGDAGCLHFMIKPDQLAQKRFDQVESWLYST